LKELSAATGMSVDSEDAIVSACRKLIAEAKVNAILATRSEKGMTLVEASGTVHSIPSRAREVFDVSGAGDTVVATMALAYASGRTLSQSMHIANAAAGVAVGKLGTATVEVSEVIEELEKSDHIGDTRSIEGAVPWTRVQALVSLWRHRGLRIGFTNGCFDILHSGHISLLAAAKSQCDRLIVALNSDQSVRRLKGQSRPINSLRYRAEVIAAIRHVDCVMAFDEDTPVEVLRRIMPDVLIKGSDYSEDQVIGGDIVLAAGGRVYLAPLIKGRSTTEIIAKARRPMERSAE
jgi:D-beta-D-heptose 7-phosphate kinase/D-beta-D-heptose 1-phosphate adenosyltransferase